MAELARAGVRSGGGGGSDEQPTVVQKAVIARTAIAFLGLESAIPRIVIDLVRSARRPESQSITRI